MSMQTGEMIHVDVVVVDIRPYVGVEAGKKSRLVPPLGIFRICA